MHIYKTTSNTLSGSNTTIFLNIGGKKLYMAFLYTTYYHFKIS